MKLELTQPDDWHLHLRDGDAMADVVGLTAGIFGRAVVMPNLRPPICTVDDVLAYRDRIVAALPAGSTFEPLMTLYLTDDTPPQEVYRAKESGVVGFKLYPAGATTNSDSGVTELDRVAPAIEAMEAIGLPLLVHGEVTDPDVDIFDRERAFIDRVLEPLVNRHQGLKVVFERVAQAGIRGMGCGIGHVDTSTTGRPVSSSAFLLPSPSRKHHDKRAQPR